MGMTQQVAFLGTGIMGSRMAMNLLRAGYPLAVWNRSPAKTAPLVEAGAVGRENPAAAVQGVRFVFTMLADDEAVHHVLFDQGVAESLEPDALVIDCSSLSPPAARQHAERLAEYGIGHLDAPVSGGPSGAEQASLAIMVGGSEADFAKGEPLLATLGRPTLVGQAGAGQLAKLCNQIIVALEIEAVAEALLLASTGGADPAAVRQAMTGGFADSPILQIHGQRMLERRFLPGGPAGLHLKDMRNVLAAAKEAGIELPLARGAHDLFEALVERQGPDVDHSGLLLELERRNAPMRLGTGPDTLPEEEF